MFASSKALAAHRKTAHTAGFDTSHRGRFSALDFARGFSSGGLSRAGDPGALKPSEVGRSEADNINNTNNTCPQYEELLSRVSPPPSSYPGHVDLTALPLPHLVPDTSLQVIQASD